MKFWIHILVVAVWRQQEVLSQTCPSEPFTAVFTSSMDQTLDSPEIVVDDPELAFFKTIMQFRNAAIQHTVDDAIQFFNETFGLDFSASTPNQQNERFFENAKMSPYILASKVNYIVTVNNWFRNGNTRSSCYLIREGGFRATFSAEQTLRGSYGGATGKPAGVTNAIIYGFVSIEVCKQSPIIIQIQSSTPFRIEPIDGIGVINGETYNRVLGHGKIQGIAIIIPDPDEPGRFRVTIRFTYTFPAL